jgi:hypothetical protein
MITNKWPDKKTVRSLASYLFLIAFILPAPLLMMLCTSNDTERAVSLLPKSSSSLPQLPVVLGKVKTDQQYRHHISLAVHQPRILATAKYIEILVATYGDTLNARASLTINDGSCLLMRRVSQIKDNSWLRFEVPPSCRDTIAEATKLTLQIEPLESREFQIALWVKDMRDQNSLPLALDSSDKKYCPLLQIIPARTATASRLTLLSHLWDHSLTKKQLTTSLILAIIIVILGGYICAHPNHSKTVLTLGSIFMLVGLQSLYTLLTPPFQGADEPDHMITYYDNTGQSAKAADLLVLANKGHFSRITFHTDEKFFAEDMQNPLSAPWLPHVSPTEFETRSPVTAQVWSFYGSWLKDHPAAQQLLYMRALNGVFGALILTLTLSLVSLTAKSREHIFALLTLLCVPSLPFFSIIVSNYALLTSFYMAAALILVPAMRSGITLPTALTIGTLGALQFLSAKTGIISWLFWCLLCPWIFLLEPRQEVKRHMLAVTSQVFLKIAAIGLSFTLTFSLFNYKEYLSTSLANLPVQKISSLRFSQLCLAGFFALFLICLVAALLRDKLNKKLASLSSKQERFLRYGALTLLILVCILPLIKNYPPLHNIEGTAPSDQLSYVYAVLKAFILSLGFGPHIDLYLTKSFWTGFGWLEVVFPYFLEYFFKTLPALCLFHYLVTKDCTPKRLLWLGAMTFSCAVYISIMAYYNATIQINIHGRYLLGFFCAFLVFVSSSLIHRLDQKNSRSEMHPNRRPLLLLPLIVVTIHSISLTILLHRYF